MDKLIQKLLREGLQEVQSQGQLSPDEQLILDDITSLNEALDFNSIIQKVKKHAKTGAITAGIIMSLFSNSALAQEQKQAVLDVVKGQLSQQELVSLQKQVNQETGVNFDTGYLGKNVEKINKAAVPSRDEIKKLLINNKVPAEYIDNIFVSQASEISSGVNEGIFVSVRLKNKDKLDRVTQNKDFFIQKITGALKKFSGSSMQLEVLGPNGKSLHMGPEKYITIK